MPSVREVLLATGMTEEQITAIDAKALAALDTVAQSATQAQERAELAARAQNEMYEKQIVPALNQWGNKEAALTAERDYYKTLAEKGKEAGFIAEVPPFAAGSPARNANGQYVAGANPVAGSPGPAPDFKEFEGRVAGAIGTLADIQWRYRTLFGREMPDPPTALGNEAAAQRMTMAEYAAKKYGFAEKQAEIESKAKAEEREKIRKEAIAETEQKYAERAANPSLARSESSRFTQLNKSVAKGDLKDPLQLTPDQRRAQTRNAIQQEVSQTVQ